MTKLLNNVKLATLGCISGLSMMATAAPTNPLVDKWAGPYGGVPPFDKVKTADIGPALEAAMNDNRAEVEKIANNPEAPTFENTIVALERTGDTMNRVQAVYGTWTVSMKSPEFQKIEADMAPKLAAFQDEIYQNSKLFGRIEAVYNSPEKAKLTPIQQRLVWSYFNKFVIQGAKLNEKQKKRVAEINKEMASLQTTFAQNVLADEENYSLVIDKKEDLDGLPQSEIDAAAEAATKAGKPGKWQFANTRSSMEPFLSYAKNRDLREKAFKMWTARGENDNKNNNSKTISKILKLRLERSKILGYPTYAHWKLANETMAKDPGPAMDLMMRAWKPAVEAVKMEVANMQAIVDKEGGKFKIAPWDYRFYQEKVRKAKYDMDFEQVKPYLQLDHIREAMFASAGTLYGLKFKKIKNVPVWYNTMSVYEVTNNAGKTIGVWYFDPYARAGKVSGAWMNQLRSQQTLDKNVLPIVTNNSNFIQAKAGAPVLVSWDDAVTMFHEFGHAIHGLLSKVEYPSQSGTNVARDFVEFPSQVNENFLRTPQSLKYLVNSKGKQIPKELLAKIEKTQTFNQGFMTVEFLASGIIDMKLHLQTKDVSDPVAFEKKTLKEIGMPEEIVMRHRTTQFNHIFSSEDYAAGYYSYLWAQVLSADAYEAFTEVGNPYDPKVAKGMKEHILSVGNTIDPGETYRLFRGRDAKIEGYLRQRGFPVDEKSASN